MFPILLFFLCMFSLALTSTGNSEGKLYIAHTPEYLKFLKDNKLYLSELKNVLSTAIGDFVEEDTTWSGLELANPFKYVKALFVIWLPGIDSLNLASDKSYPLIMNENVDDTWNALVVKSDSKFREKGKMYHKAVIGDTIDVIGSMDSTQSMNDSANNDLFKNLKKMQLVTEKMLQERDDDKEPHLYWLTLVNFDNLARLQNGESKDLLLNKITDLTEMMKKAYSDDVLVAVVSGGKAEQSVRSKRQATEKVSQPMTLESLNVADDYDPDFPVIFNIMFWFNIALIFSLIAIACVIATMDPGRDSIIYRMTSTRMKKDN